MPLITKEFLFFQNFIVQCLRISKVIWLVGWEISNKLMFWVAMWMDVCCPYKHKSSNHQGIINILLHYLGEARPKSKITDKIKLKMSVFYDFQRQVNHCCPYYFILYIYLLHISIWYIYVFICNIYLIYMYIYICNIYIHTYIYIPIKK